MTTHDNNKQNYQVLGDDKPAKSSAIPQRTRPNVNKPVHMPSVSTGNGAMSYVPLKSDNTRPDVQNEANKSIGNAQEVNLSGKFKIILSIIILF